ncbi:lipoprotein [Methylobacterium aquaticum]|uniref:Lipoprotein n=1 Tax=Methylobacterium aquaticum TaxID=270351 RepID=A0A0J6SLT8_9HYPH|nr:lipoprotein [Methylobacterium aquaticum]KMO34378.1 lipoprotein [Methylobacterium aquaticum]
MIRSPRSVRPILLALPLLLAASTGRAEAADEAAPHRRPVAVVADRSLAVAPGAVLRVFASADLDQRHPEVTRAVIVLHGRLRDADTYYGSTLAAREAAGAAGTGALLIVPQFLATVDWEGHGLPPDVLHWTLEGWQGGEDALGPRPLSSFDALDAILARLGDRTRFPNLSRIVVAGHSGGGQVAQRYAVLSRAGDALARQGVRVSYVVANPSSYAYFTPERPGPTAGCPGYDRWKYGMQDLPRYAAGADPRALEAAYVARPVTYLLGARDTDPDHPALDRSCMAEAQGPFRLARGEAYWAALKARHPTMEQPLHVVPGVGHNGGRMLGSACGVAALFDAPGCGDTAGPVRASERGVTTR